MRIFRLTPLRAAGLSLLYPALWWWLAVWAGRQPRHETAETVRQLGLVGLFLLGLVWLVWALERIAQRIELRRLLDQPLFARRVLVAGEAVQTAGPLRRTWNPLESGRVVLWPAQPAFQAIAGGVDVLFPAFPGGASDPEQPQGFGECRQLEL